MDGCLSFGGQDEGVIGECLSDGARGEGLGNGYLLVLGSRVKELVNGCL